MLAGAGSTFNQMYSVDASIGSLFMAILVVITLMLNAESIIKMLAALMPYLLGIIFILLIYSLFTMEYSVSELNVIAKSQPSASPHWFSSAVIYVSYNIAAGAAMLIVMGERQRIERLLEEAAR